VNRKIRNFHGVEVPDFSGGGENLDRGNQTAIASRQARKGRKEGVTFAMPTVPLRLFRVSGCFCALGCSGRDGTPLPSGRFHPPDAGGAASLPSYFLIPQENEMSRFEEQWGE
jgi:hypothetical protein